MNLTLYLPEAALQRLNYIARRNGSTLQGFIARTVLDLKPINPATEPHLTQRYQTIYHATPKETPDLLTHTPIDFDLHPLVRIHLDTVREYLTPWVFSKPPTRRRLIETALLIQLEQTK